MPSSSRTFKNAIYEQLARLGKAISSPPRLELLDILSQGPRTVEALAKEIGQSVANTSHHLQVLRRARLLDAEKKGLYVTYHLAGDDVGAFYRALRELASSHLAEVEQVMRLFLDERGALEAIDIEELGQRAKTGDVTVLDVRPAEEYEVGHLPGAVSMPLGHLEERLAELPRDQEIVAYCRGPYCVMAINAIEILRSNGFKAVRLEEGVLDWRARGLSVATSSKDQNK